MSNFAVALTAGLIAGFIGALVGAAATWSTLRDRMDAQAPDRQEPWVDPLQLASLRSDLRQLAHQQAAQDDIQLKRLYQWQCDVMRFVDESQKRHVAAGSAEPQKMTPPPPTKETATATETATRPPPPATDVPGIPDAQASASRSECIRDDAPGTHELTDAEIDALPPELPEPTRRRRVAQAPATPTMRGI